MIRTVKYAVATFAVVLIAGSLAARAEDWTQWRGPGQDGITEVENLPTEWSAKEGVAWKTELPGPGSSQPITWGDKVFVTSWSDYDPTARKGAENWEAHPVSKTIKYHVSCLDASTGEVIWHKELESMNEFVQRAKNVKYHGLATHSPAVDGEHVYASFGPGGLFCFDHDGNEVWRTSIGEKFAGWGSTASVITYKDMLLINASVESGAMLCLKKADGSEVWRQEEKMGFGEDSRQEKWYNRSWSTPLVFSVDGKDRIALLVVGQELVVYDPANGEILWDQRGISGGYACSTPAWDAERELLYCFAGGSHGNTTASAVKAADEVQGNRFLWKHDKIGSALTPPAFYNGRLYYGGYGGTRPKGVESIGALAPETGEPIFKVKPDQLTQRSEIYATPLAGDGKVYLQTRREGTFVLDATTPEYKVLAVNVLDDEVAPMELGKQRRRPDGNIFNSEPVPLAGGRLLLRSYWGLHCIEAGE